ncbi:MAG: MFS transporter [Candidatus Hermodarchaeota archaeon]
MISQDNLKKFKSNIYKYYVFQFIFGIHTVRGVFWDYMHIWGGLTYFEYMILQAYFMIIIFLFEIPSGAIADYIGRKKGLILSALSVSLAAFMYSVYPSIFLFFMAETLWALSIALSSGTNEAFLYSSLKSFEEEEKLPKIMGRNQQINLIALTISAPLGSIIATYISLQFTMICLGFIYISAFIVSFTFTEPPYKKKERMKYSKIVKQGYNELKNNKILLILCFDRLFINVLIFLLFWTYQPYLRELGIQTLWLGPITSIMNVTTAVFAWYIPRKIKKTNKKLKFLIFVDILNGIAFIIMGIAFGPIIGIIMILVVTAFGYTRNLIYINGINKQISADERATVLSTINMFGSFFMAVMFLFVGFIGTMNIFFVFIVVGILILVFTVSTRVKNDYL